MKLLLVVAAILAVASCARRAKEDMEFNAWKLKFAKNYSSTEEDARRKEIWLDNRDQVNFHNILADHGIKKYRMGMTPFADLHNDEYKQLVSKGCLRGYNVSNPRRGSTFSRLLGGVQLPTSVDWRDQGYVTPVKDQGECGSCWAFSATGSLEGQTFRKTKKLVPLSEQQLVDCSRSYGNYGCSGGLVDNAFLYIQENGGLDTEEAYTYEAVEGNCHVSEDGIKAQCTGFMDVTQFDEEALKEAVATVGPISIAIDASLFSFQTYTSGVYDDPNCSSTNLDHAVLLVGYGTENEHDFWLVKNSWGVGWGEGGYIKMSRNKNNQCGVATEASYPLV